MTQSSTDHCRITLIGAATTLIECGSFRLLTDPVFDPAGSRHVLRILGLIPISMLRTAGPAIPADQLGTLDAVLLSHDEHADNLDDAGRRLISSVPAILTTPAAARRLGAPALGLAPWATTTLTANDGTILRITATPGRHGPPGSLPLVGAVTGFLLEWRGQRHGPLYLTGDTVWCRSVSSIGERVRVSAAVVHLGGARFPLTGPIRYTMTARDVPKLVRDLGVRTVLPIHYEGWRHYQEPAARAENALRGARLGATLVWARPGETVTIPV